MPKTDQSDVSEVSDKGDEEGSCFRKVHPLNLLHSVLLSFAKLVLTSLLPKAHLFFSSAFCLSFPQDLLIWHPKNEKLP